MTGIFADHLGLDAVVAYVDGELSLTAFQRAAAHVMHCPSCAAEVAEQAMAQQRLRRSEPPRMPSSLFDTLTSIPIASPVSPVKPDGPPESALGPHTTGHDHRSRRFRLGAGSLVAGLALGAVVAASTGEAAARPTPTFGPDTVVTGGSGSGTWSALTVRAVLRR